MWWKEERCGRSCEHGDVIDPKRRVWLSVARGLCQQELCQHEQDCRLTQRPSHFQDHRTYQAARRQPQPSRSQFCLSRTLPQSRLSQPMQDRPIYSRQCQRNTTQPRDGNIKHSLLQAIKQNLPRECPTLYRLLICKQQARQNKLYHPNAPYRKHQFCKTRIQPLHPRRLFL